jgi:hypothetical protein
MGDHETPSHTLPRATDGADETELGSILKGRPSPEKLCRLEATDADVAGRVKTEAAATLAEDVRAGVSRRVRSGSETETRTPRTTPVISGYEILGELGRGGMGVVYHARQVLLNQPSALKMIVAGAHAGHEAAVRFLAEAESIAKVQHPNVVQIRHIGEAGSNKVSRIVFDPTTVTRTLSTPLPPYPPLFPIILPGKRATFHSCGSPFNGRTDHPAWPGP